VKVSIVIAVLNSHEVVRRQIEHFRKMVLRTDLPDDAEVIIVDDGSNPPLTYPEKLRNLSFYYTNDKRPWTQGLARNLGASKASGEYLFFTDIDHIITKEALADSLMFTGDKMVFPRYYGILSKDGDIICDEKSMLDFGLDPRRVNTRRGHMCGGIHGNTYLIRRPLFDLIGGYDPRFCQSGFHVGGKFPSEESRFNQKYNHLVNRGLAKNAVIGSKIYCYPVSRFRVDGDNNPFGLFHGLSLEQVPQPMKA
jgi:glycosyltransferase involved in cell wall biosynthesis